MNWDLLIEGKMSSANHFILTFTKFKRTVNKIHVYMKLQQLPPHSKAYIAL